MNYYCEQHLDEGGFSYMLDLFDYKSMQRSAVWLWLKYEILITTRNEQLLVAHVIKAASN